MLTIRAALWFLLEGCLFLFLSYSMKLLLLIIPLTIGCAPEVTNTYSCDVGIATSPQSPDPDNPSRPDSIAVRYEGLLYMGDASYTEDDAVVECEVAYNDSSWAVIVIDGVIGRPLYCQCEKSN